MQLTRRAFLKAGSLGPTVALGFDVAPALAEARELKIARTTETRSTCPYCAVGCGVILHTRDRCFVATNGRGEVVNRNPGIGWIGGCTDTNEFNYLQWKVITALGIPYRDTQARV